MTASGFGSSWIAGMAVWGVILAGFSIADKVQGEVVAELPQAQAVEAAAPPASFEYRDGVHYWQEDRDEPVFEWPGQAAAM